MKQDVLFVWEYGVDIVQCNIHNRWYADENFNTAELFVDDVQYRTDTVQYRLDTGYVFGYIGRNIHIQARA